MENYYNYITGLYSNNKILCVDVDGKVYDAHNIERLSLMVLSRDSYKDNGIKEQSIPLIFDPRDYKTINEFLRSIYYNIILCMEYIDHNEDKYNNDRINTRYNSMYCIYNDIKDYV